MTTEELLAARVARRAALRPEAHDAAALAAWVHTLGFPTVPELDDWPLPAAPLLEELLADFRLIELWLWPGTLRYCSAALLPYVYVASGDRHPRKDFRVQARRGQISMLAAEAFAALLEAPSPMTGAQLRDILGAARTSVLAVEHALHELTPTLKILRCGRRNGESLWRPLVLALPDVPAAVDRVSQPEAAAALLTHYLDLNLCDSESALASFFSPLFSRARIHASLTALELARVLSATSLDGRPAWQCRPR